jgi:hypothetical protein
MGWSKGTKRSDTPSCQSRPADEACGDTDDSQMLALSDYPEASPRGISEVQRRSVPDSFSLAEVLPPLPSSMSYAPAQSPESDASELIDLASQDSLASFALSRQPGKLSQADLQAMRLLNVAQASKDGKLKEVNDALTGLEKLVTPKVTNTVTNNVVILKAMERVNRRKGLLEE